MAGSDPKTNRALGQTPVRADLDAEEDPLVELARIVSEDGGFSGKPEKPKMARSEPAPRDALSDGLEAELLQELETSFAAREIPAPAPAAPRSMAAPRVNSVAAARAPVAPVRARPAQQEPDPDELLRSIEEQLSQFERRQAGRFSASDFNVEQAEPEATANPAPFDEPRENPPFGAPESMAEPANEWQGRRTSRIRPFAESVEALDEPVNYAPEPPVEEPLEPFPAPRSEYRFRGPASAEWDRADAVRDEVPAAPNDEDYRQSQEFVDEEPVQPVPMPVRAVRHEPVEDIGQRRTRSETLTSPDAQRMERLKATFPEFDEPPPERAAPDLTGLEAGLTRELEPDFPAESDDGDKWQDGDAPEPRVAAAIAPGPSRRAAAARAAAAQRGRSRFGMFAAAIILVVVIGGTAAFYLRSSETESSGPPPVIAAEPGEVRVDASPEQAAADGGESVGEAVYNRVAGAAPSTDETVVESAEEPREIARIVLPPSQADADSNLVRPVGGEEDAATNAAAEPPPAVSTADEIGPRRVPTFVVKADGSIVATGESGAAVPDPTAAQDQQLTSETEPIEPVPVPTVAIAGGSAPVEGANAGSSPLPEPPVAVSELETRPTIDEPPPEVSAVEPVPTEEPTEIAAVAPAAPPQAAATGEGYLVQLSSEGSMADAQAAYARAQQRYPSVLSSLQPQIQEADLGAKGIFFRVRVGPWASREEAVGVCEQLKSAGGNCFVAK